jgi:hypothetical protein
MNAQEVVLAFIDRLIQCILALRESYDGAARSTPSKPLQLVPVGGGQGVRCGRLEGVGDFKLHGAGCHIELLSGEEIDFDWDESGHETFDGWRLSQFARSIGVSRIAEADLIVAARSLRQVTEVRPGWFELLNDATDNVEI